ncbi:hypothetical protein [Rufibacter sp. XAAS-G3-1]|uniref:hypothetical protein n=1 Tax=Rufibacter sp. XAAS-G3-1 TaxID=2729134 RepID=UPI0015E6A50E|nr:hypothetical protein [Rufibacter sp. XAAS-G3-1]
MAVAVGGKTKIESYVRNGNEILFSALHPFKTAVNFCFRAPFLKIQKTKTPVHHWPCLRDEREFETYIIRG